MKTIPTTLMLRCEPRKCGASLEASIKGPTGECPSRSGRAGHLRVRSEQA